MATSNVSRVRISSLLFSLVPWLILGTLYGGVYSVDQGLRYIETKHDWERDNGTFERDKNVSRLESSGTEQPIKQEVEKARSSAPDRPNLLNYVALSVVCWSAFGSLVWLLDFVFASPRLQRTRPFSCSVRRSMFLFGLVVMLLAGGAGLSWRFMFIHPVECAFRAELRLLPFGAALGLLLGFPVRFVMEGLTHRWLRAAVMMCCGSAAAMFLGVVIPFLRSDHESWYAWTLSWPFAVSIPLFELQGLSTLKLSAMIAGMLTGLRVSSSIQDSSSIDPDASERHKPANLEAVCPNGHRLQVSPEHVRMKLRCPSPNCDVIFQLTPTSPNDVMPPAATAMQSPVIELQPRRLAIGASIGLAAAAVAAIWSEIPAHLERPKPSLHQAVAQFRWRPPGNSVQVM